MTDDLGTPRKYLIFFKYAKDLNLDTETIAVYREFLPIRDSIEYTVFFRRHGIKWRMDFETTSAEIAVIDSKDVEDYTVNKIRDNIMYGRYRNATSWSDS